MKGIFAKGVKAFPWTKSPISSTDYLSLIRFMDKIANIVHEKCISARRHGDEGIMKRVPIDIHSYGRMNYEKNECILFEAICHTDNLYLCNWQKRLTLKSVIV